MNMFGELSDVTFKIIEENWNAYKFNDDTKIGARVKLIRVAELDVFLPKNSKSKDYFSKYDVGVSINFQIFATPHNRGKPIIPLPTLDQIPEQQKINVDILTSSELWNAYEIINNGVVIRVKLEFTNVYKVKDVYDRLGQPYYVMELAPSIDFKAPNKREKFT